MRIPLILSASARASVVLVLVASSACHRRSVPEQAPRPTNGYSASEDTVTNGGLVVDETNRNVRTVADIIEGRFPGVVVLARNDGDYTFRIRGPSSFMASEEPLIIVDGTPLQRGSGVNFLSPADIARIDILRRPEEIAVYGVRGANGVVIISTKHSH